MVCSPLLFFLNFLFAYYIAGLAWSVELTISACFAILGWLWSLINPQEDEESTNEEDEAVETPVQSDSEDDVAPSVHAKVKIFLPFLFLLFPSSLLLFSLLTRIIGGC